MIVGEGGYGSGGGGGGGGGDGILSRCLLIMTGTRTTSAYGGRRSEGWH